MNTEKMYHICGIVSHVLAVLSLVLLAFLAFSYPDKQDSQVYAIVTTVVLVFAGAIFHAAGTDAGSTRRPR